MIKLKGMAWNHIRGYGPMLEAARHFRTIRPDVEMEWSWRSLSDFESYPVELLAQEYDLILIDHPFVGTGVHLRVLEPVSDWVSPDFLADQKSMSVGRSFESYTWDGRQWALAVDAASQVAAYRPDLLEQHGIRPPRTWAEVMDLAKSDRLPFRVGMPLSPVHAYSSFVTLCVQFGGPDVWSLAGIDADAGRRALDWLRDLLPYLHASSLQSDPIDMSERMSRTDEIGYVPLMFGYSNYARPGFAPKVVHFTDIPTEAGGDPDGALLGGVGLAISALSQHKPVAAEFAALVAGRAFQTGAYFASGGQPGYRGAWTDQEINEQCNKFFLNTLRTLDGAFVRPRYHGYSAFQTRASEIIHHALSHGIDSGETVSLINETFLESIREAPKSLNWG